MYKCLKCGEIVEPVEYKGIKYCPKCDDILCSIENMESKKITKHENYLNLGYAIVAKAIEDFKESLDILLEDPFDVPAYNMITEYIAFLKSDRAHFWAEFNEKLVVDNLLNDEKYKEWEQLYKEACLGKAKECLNEAIKWYKKGGCGDDIRELFEREAFGKEC